MEIVISNLAVGVLMIAAFKLGKGTSNGDTNKPKSINTVLHPIKTIKKSIQDTRTEQAMIEEQEKINSIIQNIENYDGSSLGQKDV